MQLAPINMTTSNTSTTEPLTARTLPARQDTTGYFGRRDDLHLKWHGIVDRLETFFRDRIAGMRLKIDRAITSGLQQSDHQLLADVISHESKLVDEQLRSYFNMNQERLIEELNTKVVFKDSEIRRLETSLHEHLKASD